MEACGLWHARSMCNMHATYMDWIVNLTHDLYVGDRPAQPSTKEEHTTSAASASQPDVAGCAMMSQEKQVRGARPKLSAARRHSAQVTPEKDHPYSAKMAGGAGEKEPCLPTRPKEAAVQSAEAVTGLAKAEEALLLPEQAVREAFPEAALKPCPKQAGTILPSQEGSLPARPVKEEMRDMTHPASSWTYAIPPPPPVPETRCPPPPPPCPDTPPQPWWPPPPPAPATITRPKLPTPPPKPSPWRWKQMDKREAEANNY